jgi:hypothetical protein
MLSLLSVCPKRWVSIIESSYLMFYHVHNVLASASTWTSGRSVREYGRQGRRDPTRGGIMKLMCLSPGRTASRPRLSAPRDQAAADRLSLDRTVPVAARRAHQETLLRGYHVGNGRGKCCIGWLLMMGKVMAHDHLLQRGSTCKASEFDAQ